jgi:hypothetical protein
VAERRGLVATLLAVRRTLAVAATNLNQLAKVVVSFLEFLAQVEYLLFKLADAGAQCLGIVAAPDSAGAEDFLAEDFREPGGDVGVLLAEPLVLLAEVGEIGEQGLPGGGRGSGTACGSGRPCVDLGPEVVVPVEKRPVDARFPGDR